MVTDSYAVILMTENSQGKNQSIERGEYIDR